MPSSSRSSSSASSEAAVIQPDRSTTMFDFDTNKTTLDKMYSCGLNGARGEVYTSLTEYQKAAIREFFTVPADLIEVYVGHRMKMTCAKTEEGHQYSLSRTTFSFNDDCLLTCKGVKLDRDSIRKYIETPHPGIKIDGHKIQLHGESFYFKEDGTISYTGGDISREALRGYVKQFWKGQSKLKKRRWYHYTAPKVDLYLRKYGKYMAYYRSKDGSADRQLAGIFFQGEFTPEMEKDFKQKCDESVYMPLGGRRTRRR